MLSLSTALRTQIIGPQALTAIMAYGIIRIFSGPQPTTADQAQSGVLLGTVTINGASFSPGAPTNGLQLTQTGTFVVKPVSDPWLFTAVASGTAQWFRYIGNAPDTGGATTLLPRMDGAISTATPAEMIWASTTIVEGTTYSIDTFSYTIALT